MIKDLENYVKRIKELGLLKKRSFYSATLKSERLKRKMTLEELSSGICSISYLSKLENEEVKEKKSYFRVLFEKLNIDLDDLANKEIVDDLIKIFFYNDNEEIKQLYQEACKKDYDINNSLIKCVYFLINNLNDKFEEEFKTIDKIKNSLSGIEGFFFILLAVYYYIRNYNFKKALYYLKGLEMIDCNDLNNVNKYLYFLFIEASLNIAVNLQIGQRVFISYNKFRTNVFSGYPMGRQIEIKMLFNYYMANEYPEKVLDDIHTINYDEIPEQSKFNVLYYEYLVKIKFGDLENILNEILNKAYYIDVRFLGLAAYCAFYVNKTKYFVKLMDLFDTFCFEETDIIHKKFVCFVLLYASNINDNDLLIYIRDNIINNIDNETNILYDRVYNEIYFDLLCYVSRYKEAFLYQCKQNNYLINQNFDREEKRSKRSKQNK